MLWTHQTVKIRFSILSSLRFDKLTCWKCQAKQSNRKSSQFSEQCIKYETFLGTRTQTHPPTQLDFRCLAFAFCFSLLVKYLLISTEAIRLMNWWKNCTDLVQVCKWQTPDKMISIIYARFMFNYVTLKILMITGSTRHRGIAEC